MPQIDLNTLLELVGDLQDSTEPGSASERFRKYLRENIQEIEDVRAYISSALNRSGDQFNKALQDLINHIGHLLGFDVTYGRYRGVKGEIGFDGLWQSPQGWSIVVETKTTDVYTVKTATLLSYINSLISDRTIKDSSKVLGLYVYGRYDVHTNQLENAITVEKRHGLLRVVSVDALLKLLELKQEYNLTHDTVLRLFLPAPVRLDPLVNIIFDIVAQEKEDARDELEDMLCADGQDKANQVGIEQIGSKSSLVSIHENYTGKVIRAMIFENKRYELSTWKEAAVTLFEVLRNQNMERFEQVAVTIVGRKRPYISPNKEQMRKPEAISGTSLYFESNLSANSLAKLCYTLVTKMGYSKSALRFETDA